MYNRFPSLLQNIGASNSYDSDAQAFFTAAGITSTTEKTLYNNFVVGCKSDGIYSKLKTFHPYLGNDLTAKRYNAINPAVSYQTSGGTSHLQGIVLSIGQGVEIPSTGSTLNNNGAGMFVNFPAGQDWGVDDSISFFYSDNVEFSQEFAGDPWYLDNINILHEEGITSIDLNSDTPYGLFSIQYTNSPTNSCNAYLDYYGNDPLHSVAQWSAMSTIGLQNVPSDLSSVDLVFSCAYTSLGLNSTEMNLLTSRINTLMIGLGR